MKKERNVYLIIAGALNLFTAILHLIGGQLELIDPMLDSNMALQPQLEILGAWHMVTLVLFATAYVLLKKGLNPSAEIGAELVTSIGYLYLLFSLPSLAISIWYFQFVPQYILLMPIGIFSLLAVKKLTSSYKAKVYESA